MPTSWRRRGSRPFFRTSPRPGITEPSRREDRLDAGARVGRAADHLENAVLGLDRAQPQSVGVAGAAAPRAHSRRCGRRAPHPGSVHLRPRGPAWSVASQIASSEASVSRCSLSQGSVNFIARARHRSWARRAAEAVVAQPAQIGLEEGAQVRDAVFQHRHAVDAHAEGEALPFLGVEADRLQHLRDGPSRSPGSPASRRPRRRSARPRVRRQPISTWPKGSVNGK